MASFLDPRRRHLRILMDETAALMRNQAKKAEALHIKNWALLAPEEMAGSINTIRQIAKLLREEIHKKTPGKRRSKKSKKKC